MNQDVNQPISADKAVAGLKAYGQLACNRRNDVFWVEYCPELGGRNCLVCWSNGRSENLTPENFDVRSRVHEYGGLSWCLISDDEWVFVNQKDQQLYVQSFGDRHPDRLTDVPEIRYGNPVYDSHHHRIIAIEEDQIRPDDVINRLVAISLEDGSRALLHEGHDFYVDPALSHDGNQLSFITWDHPEQPWTASQWHLAALNAQGQIAEHRIIAGQGNDQSVHQPQFDSAGQVFAVSDQDGWWNVCQPVSHLGASSKVSVVCSMEAECMTAPWQFGARHYVMADTECFIIAFSQARASLLAYEAGQQKRELASEYSHFQSLTASETHLYCVAASPAQLPVVIQVDRLSGQVEELTTSTWPQPASSVVTPESIVFAVDNAHIQGFFYSPAESGCNAEPPPLVVFLHGGPSASTYPTLQPKIQYWAQRGFAVLDLNYRGSTGFGRAFRLSLHQQWGISDVEDAIKAVQALVDGNRVNADAVFIRGSSAGGFTALSALVASDCFAGGASLYGVTDPLALTKATHKFESHYLDWLIGDPYRDIGRYQARAPFTHSKDITVPVIFFQGELDKVVVPEQTREMARLLAQHTRVKVHYYAEEGHGFRQHVNQVDALEKEYQFFLELVSNANFK